MGGGRRFTAGPSVVMDFTILTMVGHCKMCLPPAVRRLTKGGLDAKGFFDT
jgi:hypothetical protein